jgi:RNA polymerase sigma-70 factor (ECF subfamily)
MATQLLQRIAQGHADAVRAFLEEYGDTVWSIANRYLAPVGDDVEDAVQEIFVEVWKSAHRYDPAKGTEAAFIATIAHRRLINRRRKSDRGRAVSAEVEHLGAAKSSTVTIAGLRDEAAQAARAFNQLDETERQVLQLAIHQGLSHESIAQATSIPLGTVKGRIRRGLSRLRELLSDAGRDDERGSLGAEVATHTPTGKGGVA